jgi:hypothetical protein
VILNKVRKYPKGIKNGNPETLATLGTQDTRQRQIKQTNKPQHNIEKTEEKKMSHLDHKRFQHIYI